MSLDYTINVCTSDVLESLIIKHNDLYRMGKPEISDEMYDALVDKFKDMFPDHSWFKSIVPAKVNNP